MFPRAFLPATRCLCIAALAMVDGSILCFRHPSRVSIEPAALDVKIIRELHYGDMTITWLTKA
jgi:hypothetical protein